jgi:hypothetical protein
MIDLRTKPQKHYVIVADTGNLLKDIATYKKREEAIEAMNNLIKTYENRIPDANTVYCLPEEKKPLYGKNNKLLDLEKVKALRKAKWTIKEIAGDMGVEEKTIREAVKQIKAGGT